MSPQKIGIIIILVLLAETLNAGGQFLFKKTINKINPPDIKNLKSSSLFFKKILMSVWVWLGLVVIAAGLGVWLLALSQQELSFVYSIGSLQYILILLIGHFFLDEKVTRIRVAGTVLVVCGVILVVMSS